MQTIGSVPYKVIQLAHIGSHLIDEADEFLIQQKSAIRFRDAYYLKFPSGEAWLMEYGILPSTTMVFKHSQQPGILR